MFSLACNLTKNDVEFLPVKISSKKLRASKQRGFSDHQNYVKKSKWKQRGFFDQRNYIEKSAWKERGFFHQRNYAQKARRNRDVTLFTNVILKTSHYLHMNVLNERILKWAYLSFYHKWFSRYLHLKFDKEVICLRKISPLWNSRKCG